MLRAVQGAENIRLDLDQHLSSVWSAPGAAGHVTVGKLWEYYCQYPYLPRLTERAVLERGIHAVFGLLTWEIAGVRGRDRVRRGDRAVRRARAAARGHPPQLTDSTLLVRPDLARAQRDAERAAAAPRPRAARRRRLDGQRDRGVRNQHRRRRRHGPKRRWRFGDWGHRRYRRHWPGRWRYGGRRDHPPPRRRLHRHHSPGTEERPLLRHRQPRPGAVHPRLRPPLPGGHPAPRRPR